jgi:hypothetical protein
LAKAPVGRGAGVLLTVLVGVFDKELAGGWVGVIEITHDLDLVGVDDPAVHAGGIGLLKLQHRVERQKLLVSRAGIPLRADGAVSDTMGEGVGLIGHSCISMQKAEG